MQSFDSFTAARNAIMDFRADHGKDIPAPFLDRFRELSASPSPVDQIVGLGEMIYANRAALPDSAKLLGAGLIQFATLNAFHGLADDNRGDAIVANLRKDVGEIKTAPAAPDPKPGAEIVQAAPAADAADAADAAEPAAADQTGA